MEADVLGDGFPAAYRVLDGEGSMHGLRLQEFRSADDPVTEPCIDVMVDADGLPWLGRFYGRRGDRNLLAYTPAPDHLLVVAGGIPYWVPTHDPTALQVLAFQPVRSVHCAPGMGLLVLEGYTTLAAIDGDGQFAWRTARLVSDGFAEVRLTSSEIWIRGYSAPDNGDVERRVELASGSIARCTQRSDSHG